MRILIATDAWSPQVNGVVFALKNIAAAARLEGATVDFLTPDGFRTVPLPTYPEIRLSLVTPGAINRRLADAAIDHIHIATEGPIGWATRRLCLKMNWPFTTSFHTRFPEYIRARLGVPETWAYAWLRRFHAPAACTMVATASLKRELATRGFSKLALWSRGVDPTIFRPHDSEKLPFPRPIFLYVGRLAIEKNIEAFLALDLPGSKLVAGAGPARARLQASYPDVHFVGAKLQRELAPLYSAADVFVFPSLTDTFGMVLIEALACGLPVAAFPVPGPLDVVGDSGAGALHSDLRTACMAALHIPRSIAQARGLSFTWQTSARQFLRNIATARGKDTAIWTRQGSSVEAPAPERHVPLKHSSL